MNDNEMKLKGIKQVLLSEFREAEEMGALSGYLWFVRENESTITNQIYLDYLENFEQLLLYLLY